MPDKPPVTTELIWAKNLEFGATSGTNALVVDGDSAAGLSPVQLLAVALDNYRLDNGSYPTTAQGLDALWQKPTIDPPPNWRSPYLRKAVPKDPWGREYVYVAPGRVNPEGYDLLSYGADGKAGGEGENADILSWK